MTISFSTGSGKSRRPDGRFQYLLTRVFAQNRSVGPLDSACKRDILAAGSSARGALPVKWFASVFAPERDREGGSRREEFAYTDAPG